MRIRQLIYISVLVWTEIAYAGDSAFSKWYETDVQLGSSALIILLCGACVILLIRRNQRVEALVEKRTAELKIMSELVKNANDILLVTEAEPLDEDKNGPKIIYVNDAFTKLTGYTREEAIGHTPRMLQGKNTSRAQLTKMRTALERGESFRGELVNYAKDGTEYWLDISLYPLRDEKGRIINFCAIERDITAFKHTANALQASEKRLNSIVDAAPNGILSLGNNGIIESANKMICEIFGYQKSELVGQKIEMLVPAHQHAQHVKDVSAYMQQGEDRKMALGRVVAGIRKNGEEVPLEVGLNRTTLPDGMVQVVVTVQDVSERKKNERERERLISKLTDSNEELERFAFVCSHDLQEPLRMIQSFSKKLSLHMGDRLEDDEKGQKYFQFIIDGAARAQTLVADILAYSSINNNTQRLEDVDANELVRLVEETQMMSLEELGGAISCDDLPTIHGNKTQLFQLFQNLINNGLKYQSPDSKPHIQVAAKDKGTHWQFSVQDNGIGIEARHLNKIFDLFLRLHRKSEFAGSGVGLAVCRKIVARHGGTIWVESEKNLGSTFYFTILKAVNREVYDDPQY